MVLVDYATSWCELVPLKTLTAREACDALLRIWTRTGIPQVTISVNGTLFKAGLTQELHRRFGVKTRYSTPLHPQANGRAERMVQVVKHMLHHLVKNTKQPGDWPQRLPWLEFCIREAPSSSKGFSSFELVYGRPSSGPMSVLRDSWSGQKTSEIPLSRDAEEYLQDLRKRLVQTQEIVSANLEKSQEKMETYYNDGKKEKSFEVGNLVLYLY